MAKQVTLSDTLKFPTQTLAEKHFRQILYAYTPGERVSEREHEEHLRLLIENHPEVVQKVGAGIDYFFVNNAKASTRCFYLSRIDGSTTDFSFLTAIKGQEPPLLSQFKEACREAVQPHLLEAKDNYFKENQNARGEVECEVTRQLITKDDAQVDHNGVSFNVMVLAWIEANELEITDDLLTPSMDNQFVSRFANEKLEEQWVKYHNNFCKKHKTLRVIQKKANLSLSSRSKIVPSKKPLM